jgi:acetyl-CoA carboxylase biotin carboxylase subunit
VTELVTGVDLIREQIRIAAGEKLRFEQKDLVQRGAAIEVRINAEDPANNFQPSPGTITTWRPPGGPGVRLDTHVVTGYRVPPNYDSMVAKLLVFQPTRAEAFAVMRRALREFKVEGIKTTIPLHQTIFETPEFIAGEVDTTFIERVLIPRKG